MIKSIQDIEHLEGVKVMLRADFNVSVEAGVIRDDYRIRMALPTIDLLTEKGAIVVIVSHLEVKEGESDSLKPIAERLNTLGHKTLFVENWKNASEIIENADKGSIILLENVRHFEGEKKNDPKFAAELASLCDIYVNEGFSVSHRAHASVVGVPGIIPAYAGLQMKKEIDNLSRAFDPAHPFVFILGGAKFETKLPLLNRFNDISDSIFLGGALANDLIKAHGYEVGVSLVSDKEIDMSRFVGNPKVMIPADILTLDRSVRAVDAVEKTDKIVDVGPETMTKLADMIAGGNGTTGASFILWNGPLGLYEKSFKETTLELAKMIAERTKAGAGKVVSIVGGGDTLAAIAELGIENDFTFVSTGGGAMLEYLAKGTLPGIEALEVGGDK